MPALLFVCRSCERARPPRPGESSAGERLGAALAAAAPDLTVREVACLNGCPRPCNVALRGSGRHGLRFSAVGADDIEALVACARGYWAAPPGAAAAALVPASLRAKLTACTPPAVAGEQTPSR